MGRALRVTAGGLLYHVLNRANARMRMAVERVKMRVLAYCILPNKKSRNNGS